MISPKRRHAGFSLVEVLLVLVVAAAIMVLGIRQYNSYKYDSDLQLAQYDADVMFQAAANYYKANCNAGSYGVCTSGTTCAVSQETLAPYYSAVAKMVLPSFISAYSVQFTLDGGASPQSVTATTGGVTVTPTITTDTVTWKTGPITAGYVAIWRIQVIAKMTQPSKAASFVSQLSATCASGISDTLVISCRNSPVAGGYVVWERSPSFATPTHPADLWISNQGVQQFKTMYTTPPQSYLLQENGRSVNYLTCSG